MKKLASIFAVLFATLCTGFLATSCFLIGGNPRVEDLSRIDDFHKATLTNSTKTTLGNIGGKGGTMVDMYVDYSDCMTTATQSQYYTSVQPAIIACNPNYYSIKGNVIKFETDDKMKVHRLLNTITNVDYSNIKGAVDSIIARKNEAILITDGEFYQKGIGANLNNPYLADEFKEWLTMGYDIYIYSEPYTHQGYTKNRYYMLFTDHALENNIQQIFSRNAPEQADVKMVHLYSGTPTVKFADESGVQYNDNMLIEKNTDNIKHKYEYHLSDAKWDDIYEYILKNEYDDNGNEIKGGSYVLKGITTSIAEEDAYRPAQLELKCYEISNEYYAWKTSLPAPMKNMFIIDEEAWENGDIVVKMHPAFSAETLTGTEGNLIRVDICVKQSKENFINNPEIGGNFKFDSPYGYNTSVYESIKQTLLDPAISPENSGNPIIYTIYLSTYTI